MMEKAKELQERFENPIPVYKGFLLCFNTLHACGGVIDLKNYLAIPPKLDKPVLYNLPFNFN